MQILKTNGSKPNAKLTIAIFDALMFVSKRLAMRIIIAGSFKVFVANIAMYCGRIRVRRYMTIEVLTKHFL